MRHVTWIRAHLSCINPTTKFIRHKAHKALREEVYDRVLLPELSHARQLKICRPAVILLNPDFWRRSLEDRFRRNLLSVLDPRPISWQLSKALILQRFQEFQIVLQIAPIAIGGVTITEDRSTEDLSP